MQEMADVILYCPSIENSFYEILAFNQLRIFFSVPHDLSRRANIVRWNFLTFLAISIFFSLYYHYNFLFCDSSLVDQFYPSRLGPFMPLTFQQNTHFLGILMVRYMFQSHCLIPGIVSFHDHYNINMFKYKDNHYLPHVSP